MSQCNGLSFGNLWLLCLTTSWSRHKLVKSRTSLGGSELKLISVWYSTSDQTTIAFCFQPTVECPVCKKEMKKRNLDYHLKRHEGYFQIPCKICGKTFTSVGARNRHEKIHSGDKKHSCAFCGKSFVQRSNLQVLLIFYFRVICFFN